MNGSGTIHYICVCLIFFITTIIFLPHHFLGNLYHSSKQMLCKTYDIHSFFWDNCNEGSWRVMGDCSLKFAHIKRHLCMVMNCLGNLLNNKGQDFWPHSKILFLSLLRLYFSRPHLWGKQSCDHFSDSDTGKNPLTMLKPCYLQHWKYNLVSWIHLVLAFIAYLAKKNDSPCLIMKSLLIRLTWVYWELGYDQLI